MSASGSCNSAPEGYTPARRTPTDSSYYDLGGVPWKQKDPSAQTWIYAREVRAQQAKAPEQLPGRAKYPSVYYNSEELPLSSPGAPTAKDPEKRQWIHQPVIPGQTTQYRPVKGNRPEGIRTFYTEGDRRTYDVGYHDPSVKTRKGDNGGFSLATYVPAVRR
ncbi:hypothetical protein F4808DRAFT_215973 [Astrocystis sublimbata]|nr:hypothetical protein F4808DRAFT_215973 [Astrocystis sublimbata]